MQTESVKNLFIKWPQNHESNDRQAVKYLLTEMREQPEKLFAERLAASLQRLLDARPDISQADIARLTGLSRQTISMMFSPRVSSNTGKHSVARRENIIKVAKALRANDAELLQAAGYAPDAPPVTEPGERIWYDAMFYKEQQLTDDERRKRIEVLKETLEAELDRQLQEEAREKGRK